MRAIVPLLLPLLAACAPGEGNLPPGSGTADGGGGKGPIDDAPLFDPDHVVEIAIEMDPADFEALRDQTRDFMEELSGDCTSQPFGSPFTDFEADVVVDGERIERVGVRKKGFLGSMSWDKPSLKIETDTWVDGQLLANGTERITLNNNVQDPSVVNQCLGFGFFADAGVPAPRCNFARVTVNGEYLGVYSHVEDVKKDFLRRHFEDDDGDLYEGTLSDFHPEWSGTFDPKTNDTDPNAEVVGAITAALDGPDDQLIDALGALIDLDAFYTFWAAETLTAHWDGYASNQNNFLIYVDPTTGLASFIPWGIDQLFTEPASPTVFLTGRLTQRLWATEAGRNGYVDAMEALLDGPWDEPALRGEVDRMQALLAEDVLSPDEMEVGGDNIRAFLDQRRDVVTPELPELRGWVTELTLRDPLCLVDLGLLTSTFDTTWDSIYGDPFAGTSTIDSPEVPGGLIMGAISGPGEYGELVIATLGVTPAFDTLYEVAIVLPGGTGPGTWPVGFEFGAAYLLTVDLTDPYAEGDLIGLVLGQVTLTEVSDVPGAPVRGTVSGTLLGGLF